jgi:ABC-type uncharacterized transport system ATPase subunit
MIERIEISGFKSIRHVDIRLGDVNVFVGPHGSGKTNLLEAVRVSGNRFHSGSEEDSLWDLRANCPEDFNVAHYGIRVRESLTSFRIYRWQNEPFLSRGLLALQQNPGKQDALEEVLELLGLGELPSTKASLERMIDRESSGNLHVLFMMAMVLAPISPFFGVDGFDSGMHPDRARDFLELVSYWAVIFDVQLMLTWNGVPPKTDSFRRPINLFHLDRLRNGYTRIRPD